MDVKPIEMKINGYKIIYIQSPKAITSIHVYVRTGSMYETSKESGIAHLLEHEILDSWARCSGKCSLYWSKKGVVSNGQTLAEYTRYYIIGLSDKEPDDLYDYMGSILTNPDFSIKGFKSSVHAVRDELLVQLNNPSWKIDSTFYKSIEDNSKQKGISRIGDYELKLKVLDTITINDLINYYKKWYSPDNAFITVVTDESKDKVIKYFNKYLMSNNIQGYKYTPINMKCIRHDSLLIRSDAKKTTYIIGFIHNNPRVDDYLYYGLIHDILLGDISSLMFITLRDKLNLIYGIKLDYETSSDYVISTFNVNCQIENSEKLLKSFFIVLKNFLSGKFNSNLLQRSKDRITIGYRNNCQDNTEFLNMFYGNQYILTKKTELTPKICNKKIQSINKSSLLVIANKLFDFKNMIVVCETK